jgi:hypothetical protein
MNKEKKAMKIILKSDLSLSFYCGMHLYKKKGQRLFPYGDIHSLWES